MFKQKFFLTVFIGLIVFSSANIFAQEESKDQLYWVREEVVKVEKWQQYEETSRQWVEMMTKAGLDFPFMRASQRDDGHYYYLLPLENYAEIDKFGEKFGNAIEKIGKDKWQKFMKKNESSMEYHKDFIAKWSAKHSYVPKKPRIKQEEAKFLHWIFFTFKIEDKQEILDILADWKALYEKNNSPDGWNTWTIELGERNDMMAFTEFAKDGASFYANMEDKSAEMKEAEQKLWQRFSQYLTSIDQMFGQPRPDLGFVKDKNE